MPEPIADRSEYGDAGFKYYQVYAQSRGMKQFPPIGVVYARSVSEATKQAQELDMGC